MTSIHHGSIGYALSPAGKAYKVRNNPPISNQPKPSFLVDFVLGMVGCRGVLWINPTTSYPWAIPVSNYSTLVARDPRSLFYQ